MCNRRVEDCGIADEEAVNTFSLNNCRDTKASLVDEIILTLLDICGKPVPADGIADVESAGLGLHVEDEAGAVEGAGCGVEPVANVA